jgi:hypothetical protein
MVRQRENDVGSSASFACIAANMASLLQHQ